MNTCAICKRSDKEMIFETTCTPCWEKAMTKYYNQLDKHFDGNYSPKKIQELEGCNRLYIMPLWENGSMKELRVCSGPYYESPGYPLSGLRYQGKPVEDYNFATEKEAWDFIREKFPRYQP